MKKFFCLFFIILSFVSCTNKAKEKEITQLKKQIIQLTEKMQKDSIDCVTTLDSLILDKKQDSTCVCKTYDYYVVVGSFKEDWRAKVWSDKIDSLGYTPCIVYSHNDFYMVYVKGGNELKGALKVMEVIRETVTPRAWVYVRRK